LKENNSHVDRADDFKESLALLLPHATLNIVVKREGGFSTDVTLRCGAAMGVG
jgi:hypothetical protein